MMKTDLTVVIPALNEADNLAELLPRIHEVLQPIAIRYEILIVDELADEKTHRVAEQNQARVLSPNTQGYGSALLAGFQQACSDYIITIDADLSHPPHFLRDMWQVRREAEIIIASRYVPGGKAAMPFSRLLLSKTLNIFFSRGLDLQVRDISSGYRLYATQAVEQKSIEGRDFNVLQELLVKALMEGYQIKEIPFDYRPRRQGSSHARVIKFGMAYLRTFSQLWRQRNSIASADYDARAYHTLMLPQRYWQRQRHRHITQLIQMQERVLDVGCGSSQIISALPDGSVALDILLRKLRYARCYGRQLAQGSIFALPFAAATFPCVVCSQVIEHLPRGGLLNELDRVLAPGGRLVLGTPDYDRWQWRIIEWLYKKILPQAYADEHITHYTRRELIDEFVFKRGYALEATRYILRGELILGLRKPIA